LATRLPENVPGDGFPVGNTPCIQHVGQSQRARGCREPMSGAWHRRR